MTGFSFRPAARENVSLLIGLAGGTGSGKTFSAMRLAKGLCGDRPFAVIDTEAGRAKHYADDFRFDHGDLEPPFRPEAYADAIAAADAAGYPVILVDSFSHEHAGDGGLLDWHEEEYQRLGGRDAVKMTAWIKPKMSHKAMVSRLLQVRAHLILCFRAEEKIEIVKVDGKTQIVPKKTLTGLDGWVPISEKNLPYELTVSFLLTADKPGLPKPIKLPERLRPFFPLDQPVNEETGRALAEWAAGAKIAAPEAATEASTLAPPDAAPDGVGSGAANEPDPAIVAEVDALTADLLGFAESESTEKAETVATAIRANRKKAGTDLAAHLAWLRRTHAAAVERAGGESEFAAMARDAGAPV